MSHPAIKFRRPSAAIVRRRAETEGDDCEEPVHEVPHEPEQAAREEGEGESVIIRFDVTCGDPPTRLNEGREVIDGAELERRGGGVGVESGHGIVQDQATFDGLEAISDERGVDGIEGLLR